MQFIRTIRQTIRHSMKVKESFCLVISRTVKQFFTPPSQCIYIKLKVYNCYILMLSTIHHSFCTLTRANTFQEFNCKSIILKIAKKSRNSSHPSRSGRIILLGYFSFDVLGTNRFENIFLIETGHVR